MKTKSLIALVALLALFANRGWAPPPLTAFTYQGRLTEAGTPVNGIYDFRLGVFNDETAGDLVGLRVDQFGVPVSNGLFTVECDPGEAVFDGSPRWLQIAVRPQGGSLTTLSPRQRLTATPHAQFAVNASQAANLTEALPAGQIAGTLSDSQLSANIARLNTSPTFQGEVRANRFAGDGGGLTNLNASTLGGLAPGAFWQLNGNAGTTPAAHYIGTSDNQPLEVKVNGWRALRLEPQATGEVNVVFGHGSNWIAGAGSVIAGGGKEPDISFRFGRYTTNYRHQVVSASYSSIGGGIGNVVASDYSLIAGGLWNRLDTNSVYSAISGGRSNSIAANAWAVTIAGGMLNQVGLQAHAASIGGGEENAVEDFTEDATIGGGFRNRIGSRADDSTIGGGGANRIGADAFSATIAGGSGNKIGTNASLAVIGGGSRNEIADNSDYATIPGGVYNAATNYAFAAGNHAKANHTGAFVWGDATDADIASSATNSVTMRASGGYRLFSDSGATNGVSLAPGSGTWTSMSDRNAKENFARVDARAVLEKVAALPVETWNYKSQNAAVRHLGPMAQDFRAAFSLGESDTGITSVDADGVALAAIQGLNLRLTEELKRRDAENAELRVRLERLERILKP